MNELAVWHPIKTKPSNLMILITQLLQTGAEFARFSSDGSQLILSKGILLLSMIQTMGYARSAEIVEGKLERAQYCFLR